ncbi:pyruvate-flavodoxin oxidoreductase, partial [Salmonella enterica subsp. enterica serovar Heidelberg str. N18440]
ETILNLMPQAEIDAHRARALNPEFLPSCQLTDDVK